MKSLHKFSILISIFIFTNCEKEVKIDIPEPPVAIVVNSLFSKDSVFKIHLSKTVPIFNEFQPRIDNAKIELFEQGNFIEELTFDGNTYNSVLTPKTEKKYQIKINTPEFQQVSAQDYIPSLPNLISSSFEDNVYTDSEGFEMSQLTISFQDNPQEKDYYEVVVFVNTRLENLPYITASFDTTNNDPVILNEEILDYYPEYLVFSDKLFNGSSYVLRINFSSLSSFNENSPEIFFYFRHITENYYKFKKRLIVHLYNQDSDIWDGLGQPVPMYTNIEKGYGIFAGYSQIKKVLQNN
jgi:hypothetical protein